MQKLISLKEEIVTIKEKTYAYGYTEEQIAAIKELTYPEKEIETIKERICSYDYTGEQIAAIKELTYPYDYTDPDEKEV